MIQLLGVFDFLDDCFLVISYMEDSNRNCMIFKLAPSKFNEVSKLVDLDVKTLTVLTEVEELPTICGAIFLKKSSLEVLFENFEKTLEQDN